MTDQTSDLENDDIPLSAEELAATDFNSVIESPTAIDTYDHWPLLNRAAAAAEEEKESVRFRAYKLMGAICGMGLDPDNAIDPYRPRLVLDGKRSMIPADLSEDQIQALAAIAPSIESDALRARIADICWLSDRSVSTLAELAVASFISALRSLLLTSRDELGDPDAIALLKRALAIQRMIGWDKPAAAELRQLVVEMREACLSIELGFMFRELADIDAQYEISAARDLAAGAEKLAKFFADNGNRNASHELWLAAARFNSRAGDRDTANQCVVEAAEQLVVVAESGERGFFQAFWLDRAIATLKKVRGTADRRKELQERLLNAQADIVDYVTAVEHKTDITDLAEAARQAVAGKSMVEALLALAALSSSPEPESLRIEQKELARKYILSSLFQTVIHSHDGRKTATIPGVEAGEEQSLRGKIVHAEEHRRRLIAAALEHARFQLTLEHLPSISFLAELARLSPLVAPDHEWVVAKGLHTYLSGDYLTALHLLVPQLESGLRYALSVSGTDVVIIRPDNMQEMAKLGDLTGKLRTQLVKVLGEPMVFEIENLFARSEGPKIRPNLAHGLLPDHALTSSESAYACWFIYRLVLLPFIGRSEELMERLEAGPSRE